LIYFSTFNEPFLNVVFCAFLLTVYQLKRIIESTGMSPLAAFWFPEMSEKEDTQF